MEQDVPTTSPALPRCLPIDAIDAASAGGKAEGLRNLIGWGLRVPPAFVIVGASRDRLPDDLASHYDALGAEAVAVRSSALGEDSEATSFAGQYATVLDVRGADALVAAIARCLDSLHETRAAAYRDRQGDEGPQAMSVVVQSMVRASRAGVVFTADPVSGRRDRIVVDVVRGLGESLVSGEATPDHYLLARDGRVVVQELSTDEPLLDDAELRAIHAGAILAERAHGAPLDLEWALDEAGVLHWLQARPITSLPPDLTELDSPYVEGQVFTRCNIGEMMPGAVTPLTASLTGRGVDIGMQRMYARLGVEIPVDGKPRYVGLFHGQLFMNMSELAMLGAEVAGASKERTCNAICGRDIPEIVVPKRSLGRRLRNGVRYARLLASIPTLREEFDRYARELSIPIVDDPHETYAAIERALPTMHDAYEHHLISSSGAGAMATALLDIVAEGATPSEAHHAEVAEMLSGATGVESADVAAGVDRIVDAIAWDKTMALRFVDASPEAALAILESMIDAGGEYQRYLFRHGHRALRELELRVPEWRAEPTDLLRAIQSGTRAALAGTRRSGRTGSRGKVRSSVRALLPLAHAAVRSREHTKSLLVRVVTAFKTAYRRLGAQMAATGRLPDADAIFFLTHDEIGDVLRGDVSLARRTIGRREALRYQMALDFDDVQTRRPMPVDLAPLVVERDAIRGAPVSRGIVRGRARVARTLAEAHAVESGEILVTPITDVGWTPYFAVIAGLATDIGSAVSHGAVVAREYGIPAVVNLRSATTFIRTGDLVELDGDRGVLRRLDSAPARNGATTQRPSHKVTR